MRRKTKNNLFLLHSFFWMFWVFGAILIVGIMIGILIGYDLKGCPPTEDWEVRTEKIYYFGNSVKAVVAPFFYETETLGMMTVTSYSSTTEECDSTPEIMASGRRVYMGAVAHNCFPFGTELEVNGQVVVVEDRMAQRWGCDRLDLFTPDTQEALEFGVQELLIKKVK